jgi:hypothetical protein
LISAWSAFAGVSGGGFSEQCLGHSDVPSWPNSSAGDNAVASPVNAPRRNKFLLLIGEFANDVDMFPPL